MISIGDIIYTKKIRTSPAKVAYKEMTLKNYLFGICLGQVPSGGRMPSDNDVMRQLGAVGLANMDDLVECFGQEKMDEFKTWWSAKYDPDNEPDTKKVVEISMVAKNENQ